jgi:hypothetical protein
MNDNDTPIDGSGNGAHRTFRNACVAIPKYLFDKFIWERNSPESEEIVFGNLKVITGTKYRQFCRARYGPNVLDLFAERYLSNPTPGQGGRFEFITGPKAIWLFRNLLG